MTFFYQRGLATTHKQWPRPKIENIEKFLEKTMPVVEACGLELWLTGKSLRDIEHTWDFDCYLTGDADPQLIEDIQHAMLQYGFECDLLVDPYWASNHHPAYKDSQGQWRQQATKVWLLYPITFKSGTADNHTDWRNNPRVPQITEYMVEFEYGRQPVKQKHHQYLEQHGDFKRISAKEYLVSRASKTKTLNN